MKSRADLISYAGSFVSHLLSANELRDKPRIRAIILFGSIPRGDFETDSDIDLFVDVYDKGDVAPIKERIRQQTEEFLHSRTHELWALKGIDNEIKCMVGLLKEWDLKESVESDGIILYGKYKERTTEGKTRYNLFVFEPIRDIARRNRIIRTLFGREEKNAQAAGLVNELKGSKLASRVFIVPPESTAQIIALLEKEKVDYRIFEGWTPEA